MCQACPCKTVADPLAVVHCPRQAGQNTTTIQTAIAVPNGFYDIQVEFSIHVVDAAGHEVIAFRNRGDCIAACLGRPRAAHHPMVQIVSIVMYRL